MNNIQKQPANNLQSGLTLAEMLVVLTILAVVTLTAVKSLSPVAEQARFDVTRETLEAIRSAVVNIESSGSLGGSVSGYVADMGRLPMPLVSSIDNSVDIPQLHGNSLAEILPEGGVEADYSYRTFTFNGTKQFANLRSVTFPASSFLSLSRGWRGPYFRLPMGTGTLVNGWGNRFYLPDNFSVNGDGSLLGVSAALPQEYAASSPLIASWETEYRSTLEGSVTFDNKGVDCYPVVLLFIPSRSSVVNDKYDVKMWCDGTKLVSNDSRTVHFDFLNVPVGPRALYAAFSTTTVTLDNDCEVSTTATPTYSAVGQPVYVNVRPRSPHVNAWSVEIP